jgi:hypothetical protein
MGWGYEKNSFKLWCRYSDYEENSYFKLREDDEYYEVVAYIPCSGGDAQMYVDHKVVDNGTKSEGIYDSDYESDDAKGMKFNDNEDERVMGLEDGFGVNPMEERTNEKNMKLVLGSIGCSEPKFEYNAYENDELGISNPDASDEERGPRYENLERIK